MANDKKFIVKNGLRADNIEFTDSQSGSNQITLSMSNTDTLNFEGDAGSLFSIADDLTGSVFTVGDVSGIPIIDVNGDTHNVTMAQFDGKVMIGGTDSGSTDSDVLNVTGNVKATAFIGPLTGNATTATTLETARNIGGISFNGSENINLPGVNISGNQNTSGTAAIATSVSVADESTDTTCFPLFVTASSGNLEPKSGSNLTFNSSSGLLTATAFSGSAANLLSIPMGEAAGTLAAARVGELPASKITSGTFDSARLPDLATSDITSGVLDSARVPIKAIGAGNITSGTIASARLSLSASDIPNLATSKITSGSFADARIPNLAASKITSGVFDSARIPVTGDITAAKITSGIIDSARLPAGTFGGGGGGTADAIAADNIQVGDAAINLTTNTGNITIDAQGNNTDIIFKGTDGGVDRTFLTIDGSEAGKATFLSEIVTTGLQASGDTFIDSAGGFLFDVSDKALEFGDNYKATFGAGADLAIFHDGGNSAIIDQGTGGLFIRGSSINIDDTSSNDYITATQGGAVTLFHNGSSKLATTSSGATVTGTLQAEANNTSSAGLVSIQQSGTGDASINFALVGTKGYSIGIDNSDANKFKISSSETIGTSDILEIDTSNNATLNGDLTLTSTDAGSGEDPNLKLFRNSSSPANSDMIGTIQFQGRNDADETTTYAEIQSQISDVSDGAEDGVLYFQVRRNGTLTSIANVSGGSGRFNISNGDLFLQTGAELVFEGATSNANETTLTVTDPTADRTITLPDASGTVLLTDGSGASLTNLPAGQLTGTIDSARLPDLATSDITSGTLDSARLPVIANANLAAKATALATARNIDVTGVTATAASFDGTGNIDIEVTAVPATLLTGTINNARISLDAAEIPNLAASKITSGTFDSARIPVMSIGAGNITSGTIADARLPSSITSDITGNAATATALETARNIGGVSFNGTENINLPGVNTSGNQNTSGTAAIATSITASANNSTDETVYLTFVDGATGTQGIETDTGLTYNPSTGLVTATKFSGDGSALTGISAGVSDGIFLEYQKRVTSNYNVDAGVTALTACNDSDGIEIISGVTVTISDSSGWVITGGDKNMGLDAMVATSNQTERTMRTGTIKPTLNNTYDLGDSAVAWRNIYTNDLNLSNETGSGNDVDGTTGKWTIQEGEENLYIINRKTGKKYKFMLEEIV